jgi:hypothetical protein
MMACARPCLFCFAGVCVRVRQVDRANRFLLGILSVTHDSYVLFLLWVWTLFLLPSCTWLPCHFLLSYTAGHDKITRQKSSKQTNKQKKMQQIMHPVLYRCVSYGVLPHDEAKRLFKVVLDRKRHGRSAASSPSPVRKKPPKAKILKDEGLYEADFVVSGGDGIGTATL